MFSCEKYLLYLYTLLTQRGKFDLEHYRSSLYHENSGGWEQGLGAMCMGSVRLGWF